MDIYITKIQNIEDKIILDISKCFKIENKIRRKVKNMDKIRTLVGEMILRHVIYNKIKNEDIILKNNYYGKPYLEGYSDFKFNISHSGDYVVLATSKYDVGIDIEQIKEIEHKSIINNCFTEEEKKYIYKSTLTNRFYEIWTLKESYIKAIGKGLSIPLKSFSVNIVNKREIKCINEYEFKIIDIDTKYTMAICSCRKDNLESIKILNQDALIKNYFRS